MTMNSAAESKNCRSCDEPIRLKATICKYCGKKQNLISRFFSKLRLLELFGVLFAGVAAIVSFDQANRAFDAQESIKILSEESVRNVEISLSTLKEVKEVEKRSKLRTIRNSVIEVADGDPIYELICSTIGIDVPDETKDVWCFIIGNKLVSRTQAAIDNVLAFSGSSSVSKEELGIELLCSHAEDVISTVDEEHALVSSLEFFVLDHCE